MPPYAAPPAPARRPASAVSPLGGEQAAYPRTRHTNGLVTCPGVSVGGRFDGDQRYAVCGAGPGYGDPMTPPASRATDLAQRLLDAQVAYHLSLLTDDALEATVSQAAEALLDAASEHRLIDLVDRETVTGFAAYLLQTVPGSAAAVSVVQIGTDLVVDGPPEPFPLAAAVDRAQVDALVTQALALTPAIERVLDRLAESPLVGVVASRFMGRIVAEVVQANQAVASRVPGLGPLVSFGTSTASRLKGAADKQFEAIIGDTVGKGGTYAVRRLNRILVDTLRDPTTREAALQVWDHLAVEPVAGFGALASRDEIAALVSAGHELVATATGTPYAARLAEALVDGFFEWFGGYTLVELLDALDLCSADVVDHLALLTPRLVAALRDSGDLERLLRAHLEPFFTSPDVVELLGR